MTYAEKLKDPRWIKKRDQIVARDGGRCRVCNRSENLHVHHIRYVRGKDPWDYKEFYLVTLCKKHHEDEHKAIEESYMPPPPPVFPAARVSLEMQAILDKHESLREELDAGKFSEDRLREIIREMTEIKSKHPFLNLRKGEIGWKPVNRGGSK